MAKKSERNSSGEHRPAGINYPTGGNYSSRGAYPSNSNRGFNMGKPKKSSAKKKILIGVCLLVLLVAGLIGADFALNNNKVHYGVKVEGVDVGGMTKAEATTELQSKLDSRLASKTVQVKPDAATEERLASHAVVGEDGVTEEVVETEEPEKDGSADSAYRWSFSAADLGASVDASVLIDQAYEVGQVSEPADFIPALIQRFSSLIGQTDLQAALSYDEDILAATVQPVNDVLGVEMVNSNITINDVGTASVQTGQVGQTVDTKVLQKNAEEVLLGRSDATFDATLATVAVDIDDAAAQVVADGVNAALAEPVYFVYEDNSWTADAVLLGRWITTKVEGSGKDAQLIPFVDSSKGYDGIQAILGDAGYGTAQNAHIDVSSGAPVIVGGTAGIGPDITAAVGDLETILFGGGAANRTITFVTAEVEPAITVDAVAQMGISELIVSYDLGYGSGSGSNREFNIERCLSTLSGSIVAPGQSWNWNDVVGPCEESTGYKPASIINSDNEFSDAFGGGICNVATGVFNLAYEAGLPVSERANHSIYMDRYPAGRDAAVFWQYPTLAFTNDTDHHIMITATYDGSTMHLSIWGTSEHRSVESRNSDWSEDSQGAKSITNYRTVYNSDGSVRYEDSFYSYFPPAKE